jgi:hypothetical protein
MSSIDAHALTTLIGEMRRLERLGRTVIDQLTADDQVNHRLDPEANSLAIIVRHLAGNMRSRWTDFLGSDGEKPDRNRDGEFDLQTHWTRAQLRDAWEMGWAYTLGALDALTPADLAREVRIRGEALTVLEAIVRQVAHYAQHVGQMLLLGKHLLGPAWKTPSIPRGQSTAKNWAQSRTFW